MLFDNSRRPKLRPVPLSTEGATLREISGRACCVAPNVCTTAPFGLTADEVLRPGQNYDKFHFDHLVNWWKKKASNRYETLKSEGRLRTELETWNKNPESISCYHGVSLFCLSRCECSKSIKLFSFN